MENAIDVTLRSVAISLAATLLAAVPGVPLGALLGLGSGALRRAAKLFFAVGMSLPPVLVGLVFALLLWRSGPFGGLGLMYTKTAMVLAEAALAFPLVVGITAASVEALPPGLPLTLRALGATRGQLVRYCLSEARAGVGAALVAGFGGAISEVGAALMVGGNLRGETRVLTTAIALETRSGRFDSAIGLGLALLGVAVVVCAALLALGARRGS